MRLIGRFFYAIFFLLGGFLFAIPKWILFGTRASRDRRKLIAQQKTIIEEQRRQS